MSWQTGLLQLVMYAAGGYCAIQTVSTITTLALERHGSSVTPTSTVTQKERERQLKCLARNIYFEAAGEPFEGKVAVAQVTLNRAESGKFPDDICEVVYQKNTFGSKIVCQFSWYCMMPSSTPVKSQEAMDESYEVAKKVLLEGFRLSSVEDALYYHADYVEPGWKMTRVAKIGRHIFYRG